MLNKCSFIGHVGRDPEIRTTQGGSKIASFSLAVTEKYKNKQGERVENTEWINLTAFGNIVGVIESYAPKGTKLYVEAKYKLEKYTAKDGTEKQTPKFIVGNIVLLGSNNGGGGGSQQTPQRQVQAPIKHDFDDEIPF